MGRLDLRDPPRDEDLPHPEDDDRLAWVSPDLRARIDAVKERRDLEDPTRHSFPQVNFRPPAAELSTRQLEVLLLVAQGDTNREIGVKLFLAEETVKSHVRVILAVLGARSRAHAVARAYERGLLVAGSSV